MKPLGCSRCAGAREPGWLCVDHGEPWEHDDCVAEGMPCPDCNPDGAVDWQAVHAGDAPDDVPRTQ